MDTKELKENISVGVIFATINTIYNYAVNGRKPTLNSTVKATALAASADAIYDYGKTKKWWPWL